MNRIIIGILGFCAGAVAVQAEVPAGYYESLNGKQGYELKEAVQLLSIDHVRITYNTKTWPAFETTDVRELNGRQIWWDMYSNNIVYLPAHDALNIEHSVANSWWGGKSGSQDAYADLFHLNPSDQNANNKKSSNPPGTVVDPRILDTPIFRIGTPESGQGGGAETVFEPSDEYKGDFARAYFYVFTTYADLDWKEESAYIYDTDGELQPWAVELLLKWHRDDPVDDKEINRNEAIYALQNNRNPYIDHPELIEYIWGDKAGSAYTEDTPAVAVNRPEAPVFTKSRLTGVNTYSRRWWDGIQQKIEYSGGTLMLSIDGRDYFESNGETYIDPAADMNETHTYQAYVVNEVDGYQLRSSIATLTLDPLDSSETNFSRARWTRVEDSSEIEDDNYYLILSSNTLHAMSTDGGVPSKGFMESVGFVDFNDEDMVIEIPAATAVVKIEAAADGKHRLSIYDTREQLRGFWKATAKNQMRVNASEYTPAEASINTSGNFIFKFDEFGSLQFNKTQPRFLNYESTQAPVYLYKFLDFNGGSGINVVNEEKPWGVGVENGNITIDNATAIFDLSGRRVEGKNLTKGVYIVVGNGRSTKIAL